MKIFGTFCLSIMTALLFAQTPAQSLYDTPRMVVSGEASTTIDADNITCWLNITDNNMYEVDYANYDEGKFKKIQSDLIDKLGCRQNLTSPAQLNLGMGPFSLQFTSLAQYQAVLQKVPQYNTEVTAVYLEVISATVTSDKSKKLSSQMIIEAIADAKAKAESMAKAMGVVLGTPLFVEEVASYPYGEESYSGEYYGSSDVLKVTITSRIQVQYELKR
jgi:uncharacterized protein YggE